MTYYKLILLETVGYCTEIFSNIDFMSLLDNKLWFLLKPKSLTDCSFNANADTILSVECDVIPENT